MIKKLLRLLYEKTKPSGYGWLRKSDVIERLEGQRPAESTIHTSDPIQGKIFIGGWNEAIDDCIDAVRKL
jgi:hypothetical protein